MRVNLYSNMVRPVRCGFILIDDDLVESPDAINENTIKHDLKTIEGAKNDDGKLRWDLVPFDALEEIVKVYTFGAKKYDEDNWRKGIRWKRIAAAIFRHMVAFMTGNETDNESGLPHLAHAGWGILTLIWYSKHRRRLDDRYIPNEKQR